MLLDNDKFQSANIVYDEYYWSSLPKEISDLNLQI